MKICKRCLYGTLHPLHLTFDAAGVCSGCRVHEEKDRLDWAKREEKLSILLRSYRNVSGNNYDCIIPVSGARDSFFIVHTVKKVHGLNPLLVTYNKHYNTDLGIRNLARLRTELDCDLITQTVQPQTVKEITRATLRHRGSIYWHCLAGQTVFPVQMAVKLKIPLIVWGAHQGLDQVGMFSHLDEVEMTRKYRKEHDLMGLEADDLVNESDHLTEDHVRPYRYPFDEEIERVGVRGIYLGNYIRWDTKAQHESMLRQYDYETSPQTRTFDTYNDVDCFNYSDVHDYLKDLKHGYGKVTDHVNREIRLRRLTREEGIALIREYGERPPAHLDSFLEWIGMTANAFQFVADQHRNPAVWHRDRDWKWQRRSLLPSQESAAEIDPHRLEKTGECRFITTPSKRPDYRDDRYILVGKGHYGPSSS